MFLVILGNSQTSQLLTVVSNAASQQSKVLGFNPDLSVWSSPHHAHFFFFFHQGAGPNSSLRMGWVQSNSSTMFYIITDDSSSADNKI